MALSRTALFLVLALGAGAAALAQPADPPANHPFAASQPIAGRYIVVFKAHVANPAAEAASLARGLGGQLHHTYTSAIKGFAATLPDAALQALRNNPNVDYVEQDQTVSLNHTPPEGGDSVEPTQTPATWGLDRIDQPMLPLNSGYHYHYTGALSPSGRVNAFIIDTGIRATHTDFWQSASNATSRVLTGRNFVSGADDTNTDDCNGHGTHVAGTVGGLAWGVAKGVALIPVRVLNCQGSGTWSGVIAGIDWVSKSPLRPAVANMSLGGGASSSVDAAVAGAVNQGVTMVVAAGNSNADACNYSPARAPSAITVGATTSGDSRASYSNYGKCLDIFAPGSGITSAWKTSDSATNTISGTSMASPHAAGVAALALAANTAASPWAVAYFLTTNGTVDRLTVVGSGSPNLLVYSLAQDSPTEPPRQTVTVAGIAGSSFKVGSNWRASAVVTLRDVNNSSAVVANATVSGSFTPGGTASCVTDSTSSCKLTSGTINRNIGMTKFSVTGVSGPLVTYQQGVTTEIPIDKP